MADENTDASQKTEQPTQKRLDEARAKGNVARFAETKHAAMIGGAALAMATTPGLLAQGLVPVLTTLWGDAETFELSPTGAADMFGGLMGGTLSLIGNTLGAAIACNSALR